MIDHPKRKEGRDGHKELNNDSVEVGVDGSKACRR